MTTLSQEEVVLHSHCFCTSFILSGGKLKELKNQAAAFQIAHDKRNQQEIQEKKGKKSIRAVFSCGTDFILENKHHLSARIRPLTPEEFKITEMNDYVREGNAFFDLLNSYSVKELVGTSCTRFFVDGSKYRLAGGLIIPTSIILTKDIEKTIGAVELGGFALYFKNSPLGVKEIDLDVEEGKIYININTGYKLLLSGRLFEKSLDIAREIIELFLVKKQ